MTGVELRRWRGVGAAFVATCSAAPVAWLAVSAFRTESELLGAPFALHRGLTLGNVRLALRLPGVGHAFANGVIAATVTSVVCLGLALPVGYAVARYTFPGRELLRVVLLGGFVLSPVTLALPYVELLSMLGGMDSLAGVIAAHVSATLPFAAGLAQAAFRATPAALEEVALVAGADLRTRLRVAVLPAVKPQVAALLVLVFAVSWKEFFWSFLISTGTRARTLTVLIAAVHGGESIHWGLLAALTLPLLLPCALAALAWTTVVGPTLRRQHEVGR